MNTSARGKEGEDRAIRYIIESDYRICERNYRRRTGEIDIIAEKGDEIVFFEVKYWSGYDEMELERIVNAEKRKKIIHTASAYLADRGILIDKRIRFDVILFNRIDDTMKHYENAFTESGII